MGRFDVAVKYFAAAEATASSHPALAELIRRVRDLDMDDVRHEIEAAKPTG